VDALTRTAIANAYVWGPPNEPALARFLYRHNREPISPLWSRQLSTAAAISDFLDLQPGGRNGHELEAHWQSIVDSGGSWLVCWRRPHAGHSSVPTFKLYVSPRLAEVPYVLQSLLNCDPVASAHVLKLGYSLETLTRPDKCVLYFRDKEQLDAAILALREPLGDAVPLGVPFAAQLDTVGILAWAQERPLITNGLSWRRWITDQVAYTLVEARNQAMSVQEAIALLSQNMNTVGVDAPTMTWLDMHLPRSGH
jgi:hypothetical protein